MKFKLTIFDILIILLVLSFTFISIYNAYMKPQARTQILIRGQGSEWTFPVDAEETIVVNGVLGNTVVRIGDRRVWVESSPCFNQTCVAMGKVTRQGGWAACLPNNVLLMIQGIGEDEFDAVTW
jgi:hypothetical protein